MKTFSAAVLLSLITFSVSAFAGFYTGDDVTYAPAEEFMEKAVKVNGYRVEFGRSNPDYYGNFSDQEVNALTPLITQALAKLPSAALLRAERRLNLTIQVVKGYNYNVERKAERAQGRSPGHTTITLMIPSNAVSSDLALFFDENVSVTAAATTPRVESKVSNVADFMKNLVSPGELNGCELHLLNMMAPN